MQCREPADGVPIPDERRLYTVRRTLAYDLRYLTSETPALRTRVYSGIASGVLCSEEVLSPQRIDSIRLMI